jgi:thiol-disulfide isomerase/thioredoxin
MSRLVHLALFLMIIGLIRPAGAEPIADGNPFPDFLLQFPSEASAEYLGAPGRKSMHLSAIDAEGLIVNVYSLYCPPCHREAKLLNNLCEIMLEQGIPLKIIGLAAGNVEAEVETYRAKHDVPFPLFEDPDYIMHDATGRLPVPSFYVVSLQGKVPVVALSFVGEVTDEVEFLSKALEALGLRPESIASEKANP